MATHYTYLYLREDGTPYYVGKGTLKRAYKSHSNHVPVPPRVRILVEIHDSEAESLEAEKFLIAYYGRKDLGTGILRNLTDGGEGVCNPIRSPEWRRKHSEAMKGRTSTFKGRKHTDESRAKQSESAKKRAPMSEETCRKMSKSKMGNKNSPGWPKGKPRGSRGEQRGE